MTSLLRAVPATVLLLAATACTSSGTTGGPGAGGPDPTGRTLEAVVPPCDDTGGQGPSQSPEPTTVDVLRGVDPSIAVGWQGYVMVRQGATYPAR